MNFNSHTGQVFLFSIYFSMLVILVKSDTSKYGTLTFDGAFLVLIDMKKILENGKPMIQHYLTVACPAHSPREIDFNSSCSLGKNSLFVKGTYGRMESPSSVHENICDDVYKLSIIYNKIRDEFEFGYEVYYNSEKYGSFQYSNYSHYDSIANACSKRCSLMRNWGTSKRKLKLKQDNGSPITLGFLWILTFRLKFDIKRKGPKLVFYTLSRGATEMGTECKDYNLGNEVYKRKQNDYVDSLYQNQVKIFNKVEIPAADSECEIKNECLTKYSLIPPEEFRFRSPESKIVSCSNLTTVPIWRSTIQDVLQKLDTFLYALVSFANRKLTVISGVSGQLEMKRNGHQGVSKISLGDENEIPVPNIIYKIVKYELEVQRFDATTFYLAKVVIIVVHNDPQFDRKDEICPLDNCEKWGWSEISSSNNVYCCSRSEETSQKLGIPYNNSFYKELNLKHFPVDYDKHSLTKKYENIQQKVTDEMKKLFGEKSTPAEVAQDEEVRWKIENTS